MYNEHRVKIHLTKKHAHMHACACSAHQCPQNFHLPQILLFNFFLWQKLRKLGFLHFLGMCLHKTARARGHVHVGHLACCLIYSLQESFQSWISLGSDDRIGSNFFSWLRVCLLYVGDNMPRAPRARGHVHMPFYEGTCPKK